MAKYKYEIIETLSRVVEVDADNETDALLEVRRQYHDCEIILDSDDYVSTDFLVWEGT